MNRQITKCRKPKSERKLSELEYKAIVQTAMDGFWITDMQGRFLDVNEAYCNLIGYSRDELLRMRISDVEAAEKPLETAQHIQRVMETGGGRFQTQHRTKDGKIIDIEVSVKYTKVAGGRLFVFLRDVTERKHMAVELTRHREHLEELVKERTTELDLIFNCTAHGMIMIDKDFNLVKINETYSRMFGIEIQEAIARKCYDILKIPYCHTASCPITRILKGEKHIEFDFEKELIDGRRISCIKTVIPFFTEGGELIKILEDVKDITERKRAEEALRISETRFSAVFHASPIGLSITRLDDGQYIDVNEAFLSLFGYAREEALSHTSFQLQTWASLNERDRVVKLLREQGRVRNVEVQYRRKSGEVWTALASAEMIKVAGEQYVLGLVQDITERKRIENALRESETKFKRLYDSNVIGIIFWDTTGNISRANNEFLRIVGYTEDDVLRGKVRWKDMTPPEYAYLDEKALKEMAETGVSTPFEKKYIRKDGSLVPVIIGAAIFRGQKDVGICFVLDILERKRAEEQLRKTLEDLARSNTELEQFAYVASHDLQEPLRMVASFTQLLEKRYKGRLDTDADDYIKFAVDGANRMQRLINDLLTYSRISTRGKSFEPCDSQSMLGQVIANLKTLIDENHALITNDDLPVVNADETQMVQLFQNLIGNAIKFRRKESPQVHISARQKEYEWVFSVRDNGIGIDAQYKERIFVIFQRLHRKDKYEGTGIGLAICKKIVERHGGKIWVESEPGKGSTFYFTISKRPFQGTVA